MANISGPQPNVKYCPACKSALKNVPRHEMKYPTTRRDGTVSPHTHTYTCPQCGRKFEINQDRETVDE